MHDILAMPGDRHEEECERAILVTAGRSWFSAPPPHMHDNANVLTCHSILGERTVGLEWDEFMVLIDFIQEGLRGGVPARV